jgi:hypothetical protein
MKLNKRTYISEPRSLMFTCQIETSQHIRVRTIGYHNQMYIMYMTIDGPMYLLLLSDHIGESLNFKSFHV